MPNTPANLANSPPATNRYGELCAEVYVLDKPPGALGDIQYYTEQLGALEGPFLEAGCGSGRLLIPLLEAGLDVHGFDRSEAMLAQCRAEADRRGLPTKLSRMSFEDFGYAERFGAILVPVGTFTLIDDFAAALDTLRRFREHLRPGGRLFVDLMPLGSLTADHHDLRSWTTSTGDLLTIDGERTEVDFMAQRRVGRTRYERWREGRLVETELDIMSMRVWGLKEFELALKEAGFVDVSICGNNQPGRPPRSTDRYWCFQARRLE